MNLHVLFYQGQIIGKLPFLWSWKWWQPVGISDTASGGSKPATMETGLVVRSSLLMSAMFCVDTVRVSILKGISPLQFKEDANPMDALHPVWRIWGLAAGLGLSRKS